jgi:hypothetical protein
VSWLGVGTDPEWEVEQILDHRSRDLKRGKKVEYYVKWLGWGVEHCSWEPESNMTNCTRLVNEYLKYKASIKVKEDKIKRVTEKK